MTKKERERLIDRAVSFIRFHTKKSSMILGNIVIEELEQVKKFDLDDVVGRSEQLKAFQKMVNETKGYTAISDELIDKYLKSL